MDIPDYIILENRCPRCGTNLYAAWHNSVKGLPLTQAWSVECDNSECDYVYPVQYATILDLRQKFEAVD